jgi:hypothetical protein
MITQVLNIPIDDVLPVGFGLLIGWLAVAGWRRGAAS